MPVELEVVPIKKPESINFILGQSHFIKTVEDLHEALVNAVPGIAPFHESQYIYCCRGIE